MMEAKGEPQRLAVLVRERDQARMPPASGHGCVLARPGVDVDGLIVRPPDGIRGTMPDAAYLVRDLMFVSRITEAADHFHLLTQGARDAEQLAATARGARLIIVELGHPDAMRALELLASDPETAGVESIGFIGHAQVDVMETAKALGCRRVLAKGQLVTELPRLFEALGDARR